MVTVSASLPTSDFLRWRAELEGAYGAQPATMQGGQGMVQWVLGTQMLRLTWRPGSNRIEASVSLVDGPVLDGWNLGEASPPRIANPRQPR